MKSLIVIKFYTKLEKLGLKSHRATAQEIKYLKTISKVEQCDAFYQEAQFKIKRVKLKFKISFFSLIILFISNVFLTTSSMYWLFPVNLIGIVLFLILLNRYRNVAYKYNIEYGIFKSAKENAINEIFC